MDVIGRPGVRELLNLVDLFIGHPLAARWWRTVFDSYVTAHPDEVARHIRERNATRGQRTEIPS